MKLSTGLASLCVLGVLMTLSLGIEVKTHAALSFDAEAARNRPVSKVVTLLRDMLKELEQEAEEDQEAYDKMSCWCETNDKEKTKSIADAEAHITDLTAKIQELIGLSSQLNTEVDGLDREVSKNQGALDKATALRRKEQAEFASEEKDMIATISSLKSAIETLSKHNSMLQVQTSSSQINVVATNIQNIMQQHSDMLAHILTQSDRKVVSAFVQEYAPPGSGQSYAPQSGQIFGVLSGMKEGFEGNLVTAQREENTNAKGYEELKTAKEEEIASGQAMLDKKTGDLATADEKLAASKEDLADTTKTLAADEEFLASLKEQCANIDAEWAERKETRQGEMGAVSKALAVLTSDEARDSFSSSLSLVQTRNDPDSMRRDQASKGLLAAAKRSNSYRLATLAYRLRLDPFARIKNAINKMIDDILKQKEEERKHLDFCTDELNTNTLNIEKGDRDLADLNTLKEDLATTIQTLTEQIKTLKSEISEAETQMKRAGEDREFANSDFQAVVTEQRATQKFLKQALAVLESFYGKDAAAFAQEQQQQPAGPPPPPGFKTYEKNAASAGVTGMIQQIIKDAEAMEAEAMKAENDAQKAYETFVKETQANIEEKTKDMINKSEQKAKTEGDLVTAKKDYANTMKDLENLSDYKGELHKRCDWTMKNFEESQTAKDGEVEALKEAIASMSGGH